jgi:peptide/nickel transport system substrate-binding protein
VLVVAGAVLGSLSLLAHFGVIGAHSAPTAPIVAHGGTWTIGSTAQPDSLIPNGSTEIPAYEIDQALYLPLFYGDAFGVIHPGAASVVPTVQNGGINANATTWTFHLRPHLVWSDGQPYDARDVDFTWKLWLNPKFGAQMGNAPIGLQMINSAVVSSDHLTITFHLKQPYTPFLQYWVDGGQAPLPAHHFSTMAPEQILKSPDNLNPQITSGSFLMAESVPGNHFTFVRNPHYYLAVQGLPYLDKVVFRILAQDTINADLQSVIIDSTSYGSFDVAQLQDYKKLHSYMLVTQPTNVYFEALFFDFHNTVLASHLEVRQAIAMAINYQSLLEAVPQGANQQCTDHSSFYHPGFDTTASCPIFDTAAANQLLDNNGWVIGPDGVRSKGGQRLEFEYSLPISSNKDDRLTLETIIQRELRAIGIKLEIQNYPSGIFFGGGFPVGKASPATGALAGRDDIVELALNFSYDPDDSSLFSCNQFPPEGSNFTFYCNHALDALYQQELSTPDAGARQNIFDQIHYIYLTQFPMIVLFGRKDVYVVHTGTHNFQPEPWGGLDTNNIWEWWCDGGKC